jgi:hypothetical protein
VGLDAVKVRKVLVRATTVWVLLMLTGLALVFILTVGFLVAWLTLGTR